MRYKIPHQDLFIKNREKLVNQLMPNSMAILHSNDLMPRNGDIFHNFRQQSDLFYLTGIDQEETILILFPDHPNQSYRELIFIRYTDEQLKIWEGEKLSPESVRQISGIASVYWSHDFDKILPLLLSEAQHIYLNLNENPRFKSPVEDRNKRSARQLMNDYPLHHYQRLAPILTHLRLHKEKEETQTIQQACNITRDAFYQVLNTTRPGIYEYEIEAEITREFIKKGGNGHAYEPIVASGKNACILHYIKNSDQCNAGELILLDFGVEYGNYAADCSRTIPVNGKFTPRQRQLYNSVLKVMNATIQLLRPDTTLHEVEQKVKGLWEKEHIKLGLYTEEDLLHQSAEEPLYKKYFPHGISHFMGLDVHDAGSKHHKLQPGMVLTCEPGIYIPSEYTGIRLENDILVTEEEPVNLTQQIPIQPREIEELMSTATG